MQILAGSFIVLVLIGAGCADTTQEDVGEADFDSILEASAEDGAVAVEVVIENDTQGDEEGEVSGTQAQEEVVDGEVVTEDDPGQQQEASQVREFQMTAKQWVFEPDTITVNVGDTVRMSVTSVDVDHGIRLKEFGVDQDLKPGETEVIEFVADQSGSFSFFCDVFCGSGHAQMKGTLIVE